MRPASTALACGAGTAGAGSVGAGGGGAVARRAARVRACSALWYQPPRATSPVRPAAMAAARQRTGA